MRRLKRFVIRLLILVALLLGAGLFFGPTALDRHLNTRLTLQPPSDRTASAEALHARLNIADLRAGTLLWRRDLSAQTGRGHLDLPRLAAGNVSVQVFTAITTAPARRWLQPDWLGTGRPLDGPALLAALHLWPLPSWDSPFQRALVQARKLQRLKETSNGSFRILRTRADLETLLHRKSDQPALVGGLLSLDSVTALEGDIRALETLYQAGFRMIGLSQQSGHAGRTGHTGQGSTPPADSATLSAFDRKVLAEANHRGMVVDLAGLPPATIHAALAATQMPMVLTQGAPQPSCTTAPALPAELLQEIAEQGGLIAVPFTSPCPQTLSDIAHNLRATRDLVGENHVALASGFDSARPAPLDAADLSQLTQALLDADFTEQEIEKLMGGNVIRLLRQRLR